MKSLKLFISAVALGGLVAPGYAQILKPGEVAKDAGTNQVNNTETSTINNGVDKTADALKGLFRKKKPATPAAAATPATTSAAPGTTPAQTTGPISAYNNYDFVPGDRVIFFDDFSTDQLGEFPAHWNLGNGQGVINATSGVNAFLLTEGNAVRVNPLIKSASYLTDPFTLEFDVYTTGGYGPQVYFYPTNTDAAAGNGQLAVVSFRDWSGVMVANKTTDNSLYGSYVASLASENFYNKWHHVAIAYKNDQMKVYVDQYRVVVMPHLGVVPHALSIEGIGDPNQPIIFSNFRLASGGGMNMLGKKFTDAKIITHGINFDVDKATIKPESMGTLNMIVGILKDNPDLKFEIDGHTDNSGTPAHNAILSQQRAEAVKAQLSTMGVDAARLTTKGYGDSKPINDNLTPEGKANNRRVEFVKQ